MDSWVAFAASGCPETEATGAWPLHDPLSRQVQIQLTRGALMSSARSLRCTLKRQAKRCHLGVLARRILLQPCARDVGTA